MRTTIVGIAILFACLDAAGQSSELTNMSTRGKVLTGSDVMIAGFVIQGSNPQTVVIVATGPSLASYGIADALPDPTLMLTRLDQSVIATNDDWVTASNALQIQTAGFAPPNALEPAIMVTLAPGAYTAIVSGKNGATGVALVAVYAVASASSVAGNWHGTYTYPTTGGSVTGTWVMTLSQDSSNNLTGSVSCSGFGFTTGPRSLTGFITGTQMSLSMTPSGCQANLNATVSGSTLDGTYNSAGSCGCFGSPQTSIGSASGPWQGTSP